MHSKLVRFTAVAVLVLLEASCQTASGPRLDDVLSHQAQWNAHGLSSYSFDYTLRAMIYSVGCPTASWHLTVQQNSVAAATCLATDSAVTPPSVTIDTLFAQVMRALSEKRISAIAYDAQWGFPTSIEFAGPPDAAYSEAATNLAP
ncbi:MAG TPA: DUF6174 domain-containing protein [Gemmatimonadales bacterium]|nr:DUF6174 domain-containing protein [Gemmatimonadales bacterium]